MFEYFFEIAKMYGLPMALVLFYIYRDYRREGIHSLELASMREDMKSLLTDTIKNNTDAMNTLSLTLALKPCLLEKQNEPNKTNDEVVQKEPRRAG